MASFPEATWRDHLVPEEWEACLDAWVMLAEAHLSLPTAEFVRISTKDESLAAFLTSYFEQTALSHDIHPSKNPLKAKHLRRQCFLLSHRLLEVQPTPEPLFQWQFLADVSKVYGRRHGSELMKIVWTRHSSSLAASLSLLKTSLTEQLDAGLNGDVNAAESQLRRLNHILHVSPEAAAFFLAGSDFLDALISCYKVMNPPLRMAIISTTYLCVIGLAEGEKPKFSSLVDQLYSLKTTAVTHKAGPTNVNDSLVAELVTVTPILKQVQHRIEASGSGSGRAKSVLTALEGFRKAGSRGRPQRLIARKIDKGKGIARGNAGENGLDGQLHVHRMSLVSQIQDLFPDLGSGFIVKLLDEYKGDVEQVTAHLLEGSLPADLENADRAETL
jgi:activating signal cointegrator complex subunit 2